MSWLVMYIPFPARKLSIKYLSQLASKVKYLSELAGKVQSLKNGVHITGSSLILQPHISSVLLTVPTAKERCIKNFPEVKSQFTLHRSLRKLSLFNSNPGLFKKPLKWLKY